MPKNHQQRHRRPGSGLVLKTFRRPEVPPFVAPKEQNGGASLVEDVFKTKPDPGRRDHECYRFLTPIARMAFRMAMIATPTSPKTASHMLAMPSAASTRISSLMPSAKMMF